MCGEEGLQLACIGTKNVREDELNHILVYDLAILYNLQETCEIGMTGYRRV